jgi:hypothetical protein
MRAPVTGRGNRYDRCGADKDHHIATGKAS